ncbi:uncharacterized protein [Montipora capricornis]|uniref:uncharacterized protein n=1 Tax=Montipora capricornis TaxID=246305 RepID=UPI0035F20692
MQRHISTMSSVMESLSISNFFALRMVKISKLFSFVVSLGLLVYGGNAVAVCKTPEQIRWVQAAGNTRYKCLDCPDCPAGSEPSVPCGSSVPYGTPVHCVSCKRGETYSNNYGKHQCESCTVCSEGRAIKTNCTLFVNTKCDDKCIDGYYPVAFLFGCLRCTECCGDENDELASECANGPNLCKVRSLSCDKKNTKASEAAASGTKVSLLVNKQNETSTVWHATRTTEKEMGVDAHNQPANQATPSGGSFPWDPPRQQSDSREAEELETEDGNKVLILASLLPFTTIAVVLVLIIFCMIHQGRLQHYCQASGRARNDRAVPIPLETIASCSQEMKAVQLSLENFEKDHMELFDWMCSRLDNGRRSWFRKDYERLAAKFKKISLEERNALHEELTRNGSPSKLLMNLLQTKYPELTVPDFLKTIKDIGRNDIAKELFPLVKHYP